jgi:hypothetical protein
LLLLALAVPWPAAASSLFADDFEGGTLLKTDTPAGQWDVLVAPVAVNSLTPSPLAAHRGRLGLRQIDADGQTGVGNENHLQADLATPSPSVYLRFWSRSTHYDAGEYFLGAMVMVPVPVPFSGTGQAETFQLDPVLDRFASGGFSADASYNFGYTDAGDVTRWRLFEGAMLGLGTDAGTRVLWLDGVEVIRLSGIDWSGERFGGLNFGEYYGDLQYRGTLDFDDVRIDTAPPATRFEVTASDLTVGRCTPIGVALRHASGATASAPYPLSADLLVSGAAAQLFSDVSCSQPLSAAAFAAGQTDAPVYVRATAAGQLSITASMIDLLSGTTTVAATGSFDPIELHLGCGCGQPSEASLGWSLALWLLWSTRRARPTRQPSSPQSPNGPVVAGACRP